MTSLRTYVENEEASSRPTCMSGSWYCFLFIHISSKIWIIRIKRFSYRIHFNSSCTECFEQCFHKKKHVCSIGTVWLIIRKVLVYEKTMIIVSYFMVYWKLKILKVLSVHSSYKIIKHYTKVIKTFQFWFDHCLPYLYAVILCNAFKKHYRRVYC